MWLGGLNSALLLTSSLTTTLAVERSARRRQTLHDWLPSR